MRHETTLGGIPATLAAGPAQVEALAYQVRDNMKQLAERLREGARSITAELELPLQVISIGHPLGLYWFDELNVDFETALASDKTTMWKISMALFNEVSSCSSLLLIS